MISTVTSSALPPCVCVPLGGSEMAGVATGYSIGSSGVDIRAEKFHA